MHPLSQLPVLATWPQAMTDIGVGGFEAEFEACRILGNALQGVMCLNKTNL
jgi:hypothetical protein